MSSEDELSIAQLADTPNPQSQKRATRSDQKLADQSLADLMLLDTDEESGHSAEKKGTKGRLKRLKRASDMKEKPSKHRKSSTQGQRKSGRSHVRQDYNDEDASFDDLLTDSDVAPVKVKKSTTVPTVHKENEIFSAEYDPAWEDRHWDICEVCRRSTAKRLVYCQGCAVGVHQHCLRHGPERTHHVTKIDTDEYVLQCRHCVGRGGEKGGNRSFITGKVGPLCLPFTPIVAAFPPAKDTEELTEEEKLAREKDDARMESEREELRKKLYDTTAIMFRCNRCLRAAMYEDLNDPEDDTDFDPAQCQDCNDHKDLRVDLVLGWRDMVEDKWETMEVNKRELPSDYLREYLVKWKEHPYTEVEWISASWLHGIAIAKKKNFDAKQTDAIANETDVIIEDFNKVEVILDVTYKGDNTFEEMGFEDEEEAHAAMSQVTQILVKWQQVSYDDITWASPPKHNLEDDLHKERFEAYSAAYKDWVRGFYIMVEKTHATKAVKISDVPFTILEKKKQPEELVGGELMPYQMEGLNWLYYQYYSKHPAILADEMGLGKTIQIIALLSVLFTDWAIAPFLIVAPNSTISNWKREFQKWAPQIRVATFYGEKASKSVVEKYEMIHKDTSGQPLKVHAVITSYNTVETDSTLLKKYHWACLIVDEGQRLKNDASILFRLLSDFRVNHRILLTGTPLQNNTKELFNLLQFLDPKKMNAEALEEHFNIEKQESLTELHAMLQPYFLRRTKVQVLKFLPSKNEVIVPVTMTSLQRELYKTILTKNAQLMRLVMSRAASGKAVQNYNNTSLGNILQQIRKILSHPFIYGPDIEERIDDEEQSLKNLTNACAKLQLLRILIPELKSRGHRILIFCQYIMMLDILEDWMDGSDILHCRIDGSTPTPERQEMIDRFNGKGSDVTCFLLSTRAGGVGINLATADTVIIYDADFNPHQDLQAVARAHRIGQKNKVVVFTLVTRNTAEEKILQMGRKKMVLDQLIIENMAKKEENIPYHEILSFGAAALFEEEAKNELVYDINTVKNLIDSSYADIAIDRDDDVVEGEKPKDSFGFAKIWAGDTLADEDLGESAVAQREATEDLWAKILAQRAIEAKAEADKKSAEFSKGRRRTVVKNYNEQNAGKAVVESASRPRTADEVDSLMDLDGERISDAEDFVDTRVTDSSTYSEYSSGDDDSRSLGPGERQVKDKYRGVLGANGIADVLKRPTFTAASTVVPPTLDFVNTAKKCKICGKIHLGGQCQIRNVPIEVCTLCKTAHFSGSKGRGRGCPVFTSIPDMKAILEDLKRSAEPPELVEQAKAYLRATIGHLTRAERSAKSKAAMALIIGTTDSTSTDAHGEQGGAVAKANGEVHQEPASALGAVSQAVSAAPTNQSSTPLRQQMQTEAGNIGAGQVSSITNEAQLSTLAAPAVQPPSTASQAMPMEVFTIDSD